VIAIRVEESGLRLRLRNTNPLRHSFADLSRRNGEERRIVLEPGQVKDVPLTEGMVYLVTPRGVEYETLAP
jgi:hypothetical protein